MKKEITKSEYLQLEGLMKLAHDSYKFQEECNAAMNEIIGNEDLENTWDKWTLLFDEYLQDSPDTRTVLKTMGIKIKKETKKKQK